MKRKILIIDDEPALCTGLMLALETDYDADFRLTAREGLEYLKIHECDLVLLDQKIGAEDGLETLREIKAMSPELVIIMMTAYGTIKSSVQAIKHGAFTYLTKPLDVDELKIHITQALEFRRLNERIAILTDELKQYHQYGKMIGNSSAMQQIYHIIDRIKDTNTCVLIRGESGTGKELAARAIHHQGKRHKEPFIAINCAAIPEGLLEEEFFGHKKGAFTGADRDKKGKFLLADKGTLFLDEIGDMSPRLQAKLLRALQEKEFTPIGGTTPITTDVRIIAATNRDLQQMVAENSFREDLFYRLNVMELQMPSLRERKEDIPLFCSYFIQKFSRDLGFSVEGISGQAEEALLAYDWPGNIRELENTLEYAMLLSDRRAITLADLPERVKGKRPCKQDFANSAREYRGETLKDLERGAIKQCLAKNGGSRRETAKELGISERSLFNKIKEYGLP